MGTITGQQIADRAWTKVNEATGSTAVRWPVDEALMWINDGQRECVNQLPQAWSKKATPTLVIGSRQDFSTLSITDGISLIDIICNINGSTRGRSVTKRERAWLDDQKPDWHATSGAEAVHWMYDERDPKAFYIFPHPTSGTAKIELIYSAIPTDLASLAGAITIDDIFANALQFFLLFSFYSKDATYTKNPASASAYWQLFMQSLGLRGTNLAGSDKIGTIAATGAIG